MSHRLHNREVLRQSAYVIAVQTKNQEKVLGAIARLLLAGKPFTKQEAIAAAGLYITGHRAKTYIDRNPVLAEAYQVARQKLEVSL